MSYQLWSLPSTGTAETTSSAENFLRFTILQYEESGSELR